MLQFYTIDFIKNKIKKISPKEVLKVDNIYYSYDDAIKAVVELIKYNQMMIKNCPTVDLRKLFESEIERLKKIK